MTKFIIKRYLTSGDRQSRHKTGIVLSAAGILFNLLLFLLKFIAGILSGSIAVTVDGFNNLADSCSCILALLGFKLGDKKPNKKYPMGYGRLEYLSGLLISAVILFIGAKMLLSSITKVLHPETVDSSPIVIAILIISILIKGYMYYYNSKIGKMIQSSGMRAAALDSLSDCCATFAILTAILIEKLTGFNADGFTGVLVALCIIYAGITAVKESIEPLLGKNIDSATTEKLLQILYSYPQIRNVSRILLHDYGPYRKLITFYLDADESENLIPHLRKEISKYLEMEAVICPITTEKDFYNKENKIFPPRQKYIKKDTNTGV